MVVAERVSPARRPRKVLVVSCDIRDAMLDDSLPIRKAFMTARQRWTILVASTGGALEVFDFVIFGFFARTIGSEF
ncbi:MAG: hypothetical protein QOF46_2650, partial [Paraburkholderia sp.]|nr:hypothetical protein [Paraburkholderia sp.]